MTRVVIIGGGISGLTTAYAVEQLAQRAELDIETLVLEKQQRTGGKIWSIQEEGFLCEWGPNGFLDNKPMTLDLCRSLGVSEQLLRSDDNARKRFIYSDSILHRLPENGPSFLQSKLISWPGKLRLAYEMLVPKRTDPSDETLAEFGRRRLGEEALNKLIAPMVSGIFAGDPETMSLKSCFPKIYQLEQEYGGLIRAMVRLAKQKRAEKKAGKVVASAAGPGGVLTSFNQGIQQLTDGVVAALKGEVRCGCQVVRLEAKQDGFLLHLETGEQIEADLVVSAAPAYAAAAMLEPLSGKAAELLMQIPYATMNVVCFGYQRERIAHDLNGFGYLIPKAEGRSILGTLWDSSIFPHRAPEGHVLLRSMMGGAADNAAINLSEDEVKQRTMTDLQQIMGIDAEPDFVRIFRHQHAIPQYTRGHGERLMGIGKALQGHPGLLLSGNAFSGIGLNDCVNSANQTAAQAIEQLQQRQ